MFYITHIKSNASIHLLLTGLFSPFGYHYVFGSIEANNQFAPRNFFVPRVLRSLPSTPNLRRCSCTGSTQHTATYYFFESFLYRRPKTQRPPYTLQLKSFLHSRHTRSGTSGLYICTYCLPFLILLFIFRILLCRCQTLLTIKWD